MSAPFVKMPPPDRAKSATNEAPMAYPLTISASPLKILYTATSPNKAIPTTPSPMTAPPLIATSSAAWTPPDSAAAVVRELARVAMAMPRNPAIALATAPARKATDVRQPIPNATSTKITTTNTATYLYSRLRKARAPF